MKLTDSPSQIQGLGVKIKAALGRLGLSTIQQLIEHTPRRYDDFSSLSPIAQLTTGKVSIQAQINQIKTRYLRRGLNITEALVSDDSGHLAVVWFNQPYRARQLKTKTDYFLSGNYSFSGRHLQLVNPRIEPVSNFPIQTARICPVYPATKDLNSAQLIRLIAKVRPLITQIADPWPAQLLQMAQLIPYGQLLDQLHFPASAQQLSQANHQLSLRRLLLICLASEMLKQKQASQVAVSIPPAFDKLKQLVADLPFKLTDQQRRLSYQLIKQMDSRRPLNQLVQGDVGSGKTIIGLLVAVNVIEAGGQVALMAPTALLANQHYQTTKKLIGKYLAKDSYCLLSAQTKDKAKVYRQLKSGQIKLVIGTQALIQAKLVFKQLQLVIVDEQHRFGVEQRQQLTSKATKTPHVLSLTATPIPRSLQLTFFRELAVSTLSQKPAARQAVTTQLLPLAARNQLLTKLLAQAGPNNQLYVVCPAIDSEDVSDPVEAAEKLLTTIKADLKYAVIHGRQKTETRDKLLKDFAQGKSPVLITTRVIEAGIDVATANTIVILSPERFGLAQLHQLRGRVGRGDQPGHCYLAQADNNPASSRLQAVVNSSDGFYLSELDLEIRGPGEIYGTRQSGPLAELSQLSFSDHKARAQAVKLAAQVVSDLPDLLEYPSLKREIEAVWQVTNLN